MVLASLATVVPMLCFLVFASPHPAATVVLTALTMLAMLSLWTGGLSDPGILPRQPPPPVQGPPGMVVNRNRTAVVAIPRPQGSDQPTEVTVDRKWCYTCNLLRPPRASHCPYCDVCVERHDHHCPWFGTCVGRRNYGLFYLFVNSITVLGVAVTAAAVWSMVAAAQAVKAEGVLQSNNAAFWEAARRQHYIAVVVGIYAVCILTCVGGLCGYHTRIVCENRTTHEDMRLHSRVRARPSIWNRGVVGNCRELVCAPRGPSLLRRALAGADGVALTAAEFDVAPTVGAPTAEAPEMIPLPPAPVDNEPSPRPVETPVEDPEI